MKISLSIALGLTTLILFSQTPCENGMAGNYPCSNFDLIAHLPLSTFNTTGANDSWGWEDPVDGKEYVLMGLEDGTAFIDISIPTNPVYLGKLPTYSAAITWRDIKVYQNHAFIVSEASDHGMQVFDLTRLRNVSNPPTTFTEDAHFNGFSSAHNLVINEDTGFAYAVGTDTFGGGVHFINIQDPTNPTEAGGYGSDGYIHDAQVVVYNGPDVNYQGKEIMVSSNGSEQLVAIVDVTNKSNPQGITTIGYANSGYTHQAWFTEDHRFVLMGDEFDENDNGFNTKTIVFDLTNLENPQHYFDHYGTTAAVDHNGYVRGNKYYLANYAAGMRVMDLSEIESQTISEVGFFDTFTDNNNANFSGVWNVYPYFSSGLIAINDRTGGFFLVQPTGALQINNSEENVFSIFPNPTQDFFTISSTKTPITTIALSDISGKVIFEKEMSTLSQQIDISNLSKGIYFLKINNQLVKRVSKL